MWDWENDAAINVVLRESQSPRFACAGFYKYQPGRDPDTHLRLEDERRSYRYQRKLAWFTFFGGLLGALIGAAAAFYAKP